MKLYLLLFLSSTVFSLNAHAFKNAQWGASFGLEGRYETAVGGASDRELRPHIFFAALAQWDHWRWQSELGYSNEDTSEGAVRIDVTTLEWFNWAHYVFSPQAVWRPYLGLGLGFAKYKTETQVGEASRTDWSNVHVDVAGSGGLERTMMVTAGGMPIVGGAELRLYKAERKEDLIISGLLQISFLF